MSGLWLVWTVVDVVSYIRLSVDIFFLELRRSISGVSVTDVQEMLFLIWNTSQYVQAVP